MTLMIDSGLVQNWKNIPIHYQSTVMYFTILTMFKYLPISSMSEMSNLLLEDGKFNPQLPSIWILCQYFQSSDRQRQCLTWIQSSFVWLIIIIIIVTSFAPISSKIKLSGATKPGD